MDISAPVLGMGTLAALFSVIFSEMFNRKEPSKAEIVTFSSEGPVCLLSNAINIILPFRANVRQAFYPLYKIKVP